jgi:hypothetical protein
MRFIGKPPAALGGTKGYMSMERYLSRNKDQQRRNEEIAKKQLVDRHNRNIRGMYDRTKKKDL